MNVFYITKLLLLKWNQLILIILDSVKEYVWHLYGKDKIMKIMAVLAFNWFVNGATYYGLTLASGDIGMKIFVVENLNPPDF